MEQLFELILQNDNYNVYQSSHPIGFANNKEKYYFKITNNDTCMNLNNRHLFNSIKK